jgi:anti-anti-sigma factor
MTITLCNSSAAAAITPCGFTDSSDSNKLTELVRGNHVLLLEQVGPLVRRQSVVLDLGSVQRIDAAGISALVVLFTNAREAGHSFAVSNPSPRVAGILRLVGLDRILLSQDAVHFSHSADQLQLVAA